MLGTRGTRISGARRFGTDITNTISQTSNLQKDKAILPTLLTQKESVDAIHYYTR